MIHFAVDRAGAFGLEHFKMFNGKEIADRIRIHLYEDLPDASSLPVGSWTFAALDQLTLGQVEVAAAAWEALERTGASIRLLNHPFEAARRYDLLTKLFEEGDNRFQVTRATAAPSVTTFPVFVRSEREHTGSLTPILHDPATLSRSLLGLRLRGYDPRELLIVELCDTRDQDGLFPKYSAFCVDSTIIPRYLTFGPSYMVKHQTSHFSPERTAREREYLETNPHEEQLAEIFARARIGYGRADYGVLDGQLQIWEINLNPTIGRGLRSGRRVMPHGMEEVRKLREPGKNLFHARFREALVSLDVEVGEPREVPFKVEQPTVRRIRQELGQRRRVERRRDLMRRLHGNQVSRWVKRRAEPYNQP